jgi:hypothetical protein
MYTLLWRKIYGPHEFLIFFTFFERILYKCKCIIFIYSYCGTHTKIRSKLVVIVTVGSQKITLWGPQRTPLGILRVNFSQNLGQVCSSYGRPDPTTGSCGSSELFSGPQSYSNYIDSIFQLTRFIYTHIVLRRPINRGSVTSDISVALTEGWSGGRP